MVNTNGVASATQLLASFASKLMVTFADGDTAGDNDATTLVLSVVGLPKLTKALLVDDQPVGE